jgi:hypothetical protein
MFQKKTGMRSGELVRWDNRKKVRKRWWEIEKDWGNIG